VAVTTGLGSQHAPMDVDTVQEEEGDGGGGSAMGQVIIIPSLGRQHRLPMT
jgi:hypothetical protein